MCKNKAVRFVACAAFALMAFAVLPLFAAELAHRWSFNGDWADSAGGVNAVKCGTYVSLYGGRVHMGYETGGDRHRETRVLQGFMRFQPFE